MTILRRTLYGLTIAFVILVAAGWAMWHYGYVAEAIAKTASAAIGREVTVARARMLWDWDPGVELMAVRVSGAEEDQGKDFFHAERFGVRIDTSELLKFNLVFRRVEIADAELNLIRSASDRNNWRFLVSDDGTETEQDASSPLENVRMLEAHNFKIRYRDAVAKAALDLTVRTTAPDKGNQRARLVIEGAGRVKGQDVAVKAEADSVLHLWDRERPYEMSLAVRSGESSLSLTGKTADPLALQGLSAEFDLKGPNLAHLFPLTGISLPATPPYRLKGRASRDGNSIKLQDFDGRIGDSDISGDIGIDVGGDRPKVTAELVSQRLDFDDLGTLIGLAPDTKKGETASAAQVDKAARSARTEHVVPDVPMDLKRIRAIDANVTLNAKRVETDRIPIDGLKAKMTLKDSVLRFAPLTFETGGGSLESKIVIEATRDKIQTEISARAKSLPLDSVMQAFMGKSKDTREKTAGVLGGRLHIKSEGNTIHETLAAADGHVFLAMSQGKIGAMLIELLGLDIAESLLLLSTTKSGNRMTPVRCVIMDYGAENGILKARSFLIDTQDTLVIGTGRIDLGAERFDLTLEPHPRDSSLAAARSSVHVRGTFKNPTIAPDAGDLAKHVGLAAALGAVAGPLAAIVPFLEQGEDVKSPCHSSVTKIIKGTE